MRDFRTDLHIHTCLSPCADLTMMPMTIAAEAHRRGLDLVGICDHNSAENAAAVQAAARSLGVHVLAGFEVTTREEVHLMALFDSPEGVTSMQKLVYDHLPGANDAARWGEQLVVDAENAPVSFNDHFLMGATDLSIERMVREILDREGLAIASHVDREVFGVIGQLGFVPPGLPVDALEVSAACAAGRRREFERLGYPLVTDSDAHYPGDIGTAYTVFHMEAPTIQECKLALKAVGGRHVSFPEATPGA